jgi:hypothetical protein
MTREAAPRVLLLAGVLASGLFFARSLVSCSDKSSEVDSSVVEAGLEAGAEGDAAALQSCLQSQVGKTCNAHNSCAINPVCGKDLRCHPEAYQDCNDGLSCTKDTCKGAGYCDHEVASGYCALSVKSGSSTVTKCFKDGAKSPDDPCSVCKAPKGSGDAATSGNATQWSAASGAACDDDNDCTTDDKCTSGLCKGTSYSCSDSLTCTDDKCDGKGGCTHSLKSTACKISGVCYKDQATDSTGCAVCDVKKSQSAWSSLASICKIGAKCYGQGSKDISGCGVCEPSKSTTSWTQSSGTCIIDGACKKSGDTDPTGCATCNPTKSAVAWTPASGKCLIEGTCYSDGDLSPSGCGTCSSTQSATSWSVVASGSATTTGFEGSLGVFSVDASVSGVGWQLSSTRAEAGSSSLYYGSATTATYDNGSANSGTATSSTITLSTGKSALQFWLWMDTETVAGYDVLTVTVNGTTVWTKTPSTLPASSYKGWTLIDIDLSSYAGTGIVVKFKFDTKDPWGNSGEGVYIDNVSIITGC